MRGKAIERERMSRAVGITPAYAGKSDMCSSCITAPTDHPCVCGEKGKTILVAGSPGGSPLRMRGKGYSEAKRGLQGRITPAYAGKRVIRSRKISGSWDHPCVCGEKYR